MNKEEKTRVKGAIENMEYFKAGLDHISNAGAKIVNLLITRKDVYVYDLILWEENHSERFNDCEMPKKVVTEYLTRQEVNSK